MEFPDSRRREMNPVTHEPVNRSPRAGCGVRQNNNKEISNRSAARSISGNHTRCFLHLAAADLQPASKQYQTVSQSGSRA